MQRKRLKMMQNKNDGSTSKMLCVFEFQGADKCTWGEKCHFDHKITEEQRNNHQLREKMAEKLNAIRRRKSGNTPIRPKEGSGEISVPVKVLEQMYTLLEAFSPEAVANSNTRF